MWWENILEHISFTISVILLKIGRHSNVRISSLRVVDAWRILQINRKTEKYFKEFLHGGVSL